MTRMTKILVSVCICLIIVMGYREVGSEPAPKPASKAPSLLIGLIPERNIFKQIERYEPVTGYLSKKMGINIELKVLTRYGNIIENFVSLGLDGAFFGSFTYALTHAKIGVEAVARPENLNGISTYHGLLFVRKDSGIRSAEDMAGKRFAFVDKATTAGYILPLVYFKEQGIKDYKAFLKETYFTGTHEDAIYDVLNKKADIGAAKNTVFFKLSAKDSRIKNELVILQRSPDVPENCLAVRKDLDASVKHKLKQVLLNMHTDPDGIEVLRNFGAEKFIETTTDDYASVYQYAQEIGLNLETYDYLND
jgi:phosphonate transport system substrate-binding protein